MSMYEKQIMPCPACGYDIDQEDKADHNVVCNRCDMPLQRVVPLFKIDAYGWHWGIDQAAFRQKHMPA